MDSIGMKETGNKFKRKKKITKKLFAFFVFHFVLRFSFRINKH